MIKLIVNCEHKVPGFNEFTQAMGETIKNYDFSSLYIRKFMSNHEFGHFSLGKWLNSYL